MAILAGYEPHVRSSDDTDSETAPFIDVEGKIAGRGVRRREASGSCTWISIGVPWMLVVLCMGYIIFQERRSPSELECTRLLSPYCKARASLISIVLRLTQPAPLIDAGVVQYYEGDFDNAFAHQTVYRGVPTVELENAWARLWKRMFGLHPPARNCIVCA